ncbi:hypothetical protein VCHC50A2_3434B, partial [Vibrio cholerae HC-50A2]
VIMETEKPFSTWMLVHYGSTAQSALVLLQTT